MLHARLAAIPVACALATMPAVAQDGPDSARFSPAGRRNSLRFAAGLSHATVFSEACYGCAERQSSAAAGHATLGWPVGGHLVIGYEIGRAWRNDWFLAATEDNPPEVDGRGPLVTWYPPRLGHLGVQLAAPRMRYRFVSGWTPQHGGGRRVLLDGRGWSVGATWDLWWAPWTATGFAPSVRWTWVPRARGSNRATSPAVHRQSYSTLLVGASMIVR